MGAFRAAASNSTGTGGTTTTISVTVPDSGSGGTVQAGDLAYLIWQEVNGGLITNYATPSGWTEILAPQSFNSSTQAIALCYKTLQAGDLGAALNFGTLTSSRRQNIAVIIYSDSTHDSATTLSVDTTGDTTLALPGIDPTADDCILLSFSATQHSADNTELITVTPTASWDERVDIGTSVAATVEHGTLFAQDIQQTGGGPFGSVNATASHSVTDGSITVALAPEPAETSNPPTRLVVFPRPM